jgi:hypothetical protein
MINAMGNEWTDYEPVESATLATKDPARIPGPPGPVVHREPGEMPPAAHSRRDHCGGCGETD